MFAALAAARLLSRWIYLAQLHELIIILSAHLGDESAFMAHVLGFRAVPISAVAHFAHKTETLRSAGKTANKSGGTFVLSDLNLNSRACCHDWKTLTHLVCNCLCAPYIFIIFLVQPSGFQEQSHYIAVY